MKKHSIFGKKGGNEKKRLKKFKMDKDFESFV